VYYSDGNGSVFGFDAITDRTDLGAWKAINPTLDVTSFSADPNFVLSAGTSTTTDLHISHSVPSKLESGAFVIPNFTDDYDASSSRGSYPLSGQTNGGGSAPDIGADEGDITPFDFSAPGITYTSIPSSCSLADRNLTATISKTTGLPAPTVGSFVPHIYYKKGSGTYFQDPGLYLQGMDFLEPGISQLFMQIWVELPIRIPYFITSSLRTVRQHLTLVPNLRVRWLLP